MSTVSYPSPVVPGPPRLALQIPEGWEQVWAPDTLIAVRDTADGHFRANVVVRFYQRLAPFGPEQVEAELGQYAASHTDGSLGALRDQTIDGRQWVGAELTYTEQPVGEVGQAHWFTAAAQNDVMDVIQVTGSWSGDRREADFPLVDAVIDSVRVRT